MLTDVEKPVDQPPRLTRLAPFYGVLASKAAWVAREIQHSTPPVDRAGRSRLRANVDVRPPHVLKSKKDPPAVVVQLRSVPHPEKLDKPSSKRKLQTGHLSVTAQVTTPALHPPLALPVRLKPAVEPRWPPSWLVGVPVEPRDGPLTSVRPVTSKPPFAVRFTRPETGRVDPTHKQAQSQPIH